MEILYALKQDEKKRHREKIYEAGKQIRSLGKVLDKISLDPPPA